MTTWMAFLDLDEFMYSRTDNIAEYLRRVPQDIARLEVRCALSHHDHPLSPEKYVLQRCAVISILSESLIWCRNCIVYLLPDVLCILLTALTQVTPILVQVPWKMFGSSGFLKQPESGVRKNFVYRMGWNSEYHQYVKSIFRTSVAGMIHMHQTRIIGDSKVASPLFQIGSGIVVEDTSRSGDDFALHLNHYPIQSHEWFMQVKAKRGDVAHQHAEKVRDEKYFTQYDKEVSVFDDELCYKYHANKVCARLTYKRPSLHRKRGKSQD